jgi:tetratricopeptide (TPR) repeat protein
MLCLLVLLMGCASATKIYEENYNAGLSAMNTGDFESAMSYLSDALHAVESADALEKRGDVFLALSSYEEAASDYGQALVLDGTRSQIYIKLAGCYLTLGDRDIAFRVISEGRAVADSPELRSLATELGVDEAKPAEAVVGIGANEPVLNLESAE